MRKREFEEAFAYLQLLGIIKQTSSSEFALSPVAELHLKLFGEEFGPDCGSILVFLSSLGKNRFKPDENKATIKNCAAIIRSFYHGSRTGKLSSAAAFRRS
jgi:hypothetical protein